MKYSIPVNTSMILKDFPSYGSGKKLIPTHYIIHDTASTGSAKDEATRLQQKDQWEKSNAHYFVDENGAYQIIYDDVKAWHAGDGENAKGNGYSISIEVCRSTSNGKFNTTEQAERYAKALSNAYKLTADLCKAYKINPQNAILHMECSSTACPLTQKMKYGGYDRAKEEAKNHVQACYNELGTSGQPIYTAKSLLDLQIGDIVNVKMTDTAYKMSTPNWSKAVVKLDDFYDIGDVLKVRVESTQTGADNTVSAEVLRVMDNARTQENDTDYNPVGYKYITIKGNIAFNQPETGADNKLINTADKCTII